MAVSITVLNWRQISDALKRDRLYAPLFRRTCAKIGTALRAKVSGGAPIERGRTRARAFSKVDKSEIPRWIVVGTKATATPRRPGARGGKSKYPYAYPRYLEFAPRSRHRGWLYRIVQRNKGTIASELRTTERQIQAGWGRG
jgi:hypothetical protein